MRAAAKNFAHVLILVDAIDYEEALRELDRLDGPAQAFRLRLARKAFSHTADYDATIARTLGAVTASASGFERRPVSGEEVEPDRLVVDVPRIGTLGTERTHIKKRPGTAMAAPPVSGGSGACKERSCPSQI